MDVSVILILPLSAIVAFAALVWAAIAGRPAPRLIWPCAASTLASALLFLRFPGPSAFGPWLLALFVLAVWAAVGTLIGGVAARMAIAAFRARMK